MFVCLLYLVYFNYIISSMSAVLLLVVFVVCLCDVFEADVDRYTAHDGQTFRIVVTAVKSIDERRLDSVTSRNLWRS